MNDESLREAVTCEQFAKYAEKKPEWLYEKLRLIYARYECIDSHETQLSEEELKGQTKDGKIALLHQEMKDVKQQLARQSLSMMYLAVRLPAW